MQFVNRRTTPLEEGLKCEFKDISSARTPVQSIRNDVDVYVVAYLNRGIEGKIYWGINDEGKVVGVSLTRQQRDDVRKSIDQKLKGITPTILPESYQIEFHQIHYVPPHSEVLRILENSFIIEVHVLHQSSHSGLYYTRGQEAYYKTDSGKEKLQGTRLEKVLLERNKIFPEEPDIEPVKPGEPDVEPPKPTESSVDLLNPYNTTFTAKSNMFKGRDAEVDQLLDAIENGTHTAIFGLQRVGKTSLVRETLQRSKLSCIFGEVNFQAYGGTGVTYKTVLDTVIKAVAQEISPRRLEIIESEIKELATHYGPGKRIECCKVSRRL